MKKSWKHTIKYRIFAAALWLIPFGSLIGCGVVPTPNILGGCEMPARYDVVKTGPVDLTEAALQAHIEQEAAERHAHKTDANDFNGLHDYVRDNCK